MDARPLPVPGCTDPQSETFNSAATLDDGSCAYARDKFIGMYSVSSKECSDEDITALYGLQSLRIAPYRNYAALVEVTFPNSIDTHFGVGQVSGNSLWILSNDPNKRIELSATVSEGTLTGRFVITKAEDGTARSVCSFEAEK